MGKRVNGNEYLFKKIFGLLNLISEKELIQKITYQKQNENMIF